MLVKRSLILMSLVIGACSSGGGGGDGGTVGPLAVPICEAGHLTPFVPVGAPMRAAAIPAGVYRYIGGDVYAETTNLSPNAKIAVSDNDAANPAYPGTTVCLTNLGSQVPNFDTRGSTIRNIQYQPPTIPNFALTGKRTLAASYQNGTLQTLFLDENHFDQKTPAQIEQEQQQREAAGWSVNVYRVSANEFKIVIIRSVNSGGANLNLFIAARYSYIP